MYRYDALTLYSCNLFICLLQGIDGIRDGYKVFFVPHTIRALYAHYIIGRNNSFLVNYFF